MAEIHIHSTQGKVHIAGADRLSAVERLIRLVFLAAIQVTVIWLAVLYLHHTKLIAFSISWGQALVISAIVWAMGEAWRDFK